MQVYPSLMMFMIICWALSNSLTPEILCSHKYKYYSEISNKGHSHRIVGRLASTLA